MEKKYSFYRKRKFTSYFGIGTVLIGLAILIIFQGREFYYAEIKAYIHGSMWHSEGGMIRVVMNAVPAIFLLSMRRRWDGLFGGSRIFPVTFLIQYIPNQYKIFHNRNLYR